MTYIVISTTQADLGLKYRTFLQAPTFSEITEVWQCLKMVLYGQMSSHTE